MDDTEAELGVSFLFFFKELRYRERVTGPCVRVARLEKVVGDDVGGSIDLPSSGGFYKPS